MSPNQALTLQNSLARASSLLPVELKQFGEGSSASLPSCCGTWEPVCVPSGRARALTPSSHLPLLTLSLSSPFSESRGAQP